MRKQLALFLLLPACLSDGPAGQSSDPLMAPPTTTTTTSGGGGGSSQTFLPLALTSLKDDSTRVGSTHEIRVRWTAAGQPVVALPPGTAILRSTDRAQSWTQIGSATSSAGYLDDSNAAPNALNCYQLINQSTGDSSQVNCAYTLDGFGHRPSRIQVRLAVPPTAGADTKSPVSVRLQTNNYHDPNPAHAYVIPNGNQTWLDSHDDDFTRGSSHSYDLMPDNIQDLSDITDLYIEAFGDDDLCVSEVELLIDADNSTNSKQLFYQNFGSICADSVGNRTVRAGALDGSNRAIHIPLEMLRAQGWTAFQNQWSTYSGPHFGGYTQSGWTAMMEAIVGNGLVAPRDASSAPGQGWIESPFQSSTVDQTRQHNIAYIGYEDTGTAHCTVPFDVLLQQKCDASGQVISAGTALSAGTPDCNLVWWQRGLLYVFGGIAVGAAADSLIAHEINLIAAHALSGMGAQASVSLPSPPPGTHFAFIAANSLPLLSGYFNGLSLMDNGYAGYCNVTPPPVCVPKCGAICGLSDGCGHKCGCASGQACCGGQCLPATKKCIPN